MDLQEQYLRELKVLFWDNGINPDEYQLERLALFGTLVNQKNSKLNLISRKDVLKIVENHIFISSYVSEFIPPKVSRFLDIGTGGGFPGIPLAITRPILRGVLVDSTAKKIDAVKEFINKLKMSNLTAENARVESDEFIQKYANSFDLVVSRATVPLIILFRYALPLIKEKAYIVAIKGGDLMDEFKTAELKYKSFIKKSTIFELAYKPSNTRNEKGKKLVLIELNK
ncbi:MAG: 16S rRNA (guanine(527)-N(7))-methyltransferase RsmG [Ignavibacteriales bacterium]|nr:MAG: glucose-inhibited division protein B [Stygiobacter sp.]KAF0158774.1 MAG: glucose-inhibited division protein B [Ignavibacteria bacterium]MBI3123476.1 16S rRNA (guanine(527)-N(7))-methyltransferase RsmG [Ignavibacteriales bacterium]OGU64932.1 MAG: 16S rRNA (guanine(527)-N(7))-methyltransferase RsmG [Stygiobacter sp. GWC2_38_9]OGU85723.1 MAG: 16S rRNA (guanine(527)-N(7))-methyltransferase RsmG [Stygiobacter sp. RIFOXYA12_FULL_38_9]OGV07787.1 MAG: 16S rRNA (guanine(527)-N(7))-methyltransfe